MLAQARQVHHEGLLEGAVDCLFNAFEVGVLATLVELAAENLLPVRTPLDLLHPLSSDLRSRSGGRERHHLRSGLEMGIIEIEWFVVVVDLGKVRVCKYLGEDAPL